MWAQRQPCSPHTPPNVNGLLSVVFIGPSKFKPEYLGNSSVVVSEYSNPDLIPGMYPTLFPAGTGGFDIPNRACVLSFANQAKYCLDLADMPYASRYHHPFLFVVSNIIQRRTAHLQTHFTVRRSQFESVASKLVVVKLSVLRSVADHLERVGSMRNYRPSKGLPWIY